MYKSVTYSPIAVKKKTQKTHNSLTDIQCMGLFENHSHPRSVLLLQWEKSRLSQAQKRAFFFFFTVECTSVKKFTVFTVASKASRCLCQENICNCVQHLSGAIMLSFIYSGLLFSVHGDLLRCLKGQSVYNSHIWKDGLFLTFTPGAGCTSTLLRMWNM